jgi:hypothetical protein
MRDRQTEDLAVKSSHPVAMKVASNVRALRQEVFEAVEGEFSPARLPRDFSVGAI